MGPFDVDIRENERKSGKEPPTIIQNVVDADHRIRGKHTSGSSAIELSGLFLGTEIDSINRFLADQINDKSAHIAESRMSVEQTKPLRLNANTRIKPVTKQLPPLPSSDDGDSSLSQSPSSSTVMPISAAVDLTAKTNTTPASDSSGSSTESSHSKPNLPQVFADNLPAVNINMFYEPNSPRLVEESLPQTTTSRPDTAVYSSQSSSSSLSVPTLLQPSSRSTTGKHSQQLPPPKPSEIDHISHAIQPELILIPPISETHGITIRRNSDGSHMVPAKLFKIHRGLVGAAPSSSNANAILPSSSSQIDSSMHNSNPLPAYPNRPQAHPIRLASARASDT